MEQAKHWLQLSVKQAAELPGRSLVPLVRAASCKGACCFVMRAASSSIIVRAASCKSACCFVMRAASSSKRVLLR